MRAQGQGRTDVGTVREHNEDAFFVDNGLQLYVVSDGMGGHEGGEIASAETVKAIASMVSQNKSTVEQVRSGGLDAAALSTLVEQTVLNTCAHIFAMSQTPQGKEGMGCTLTMLLVAGDQAVVGHVGDSRLYRRREGEVEQVTTDHTMVNRLLEKGKITEEEAKTHPMAHVLTNAIGIEDSCMVETRILDLEVGDRYLLCSDGVHGHFKKPGHLKGPLEGDDPQKIANDLIDRVNAYGADDNCTAVVVDVVDSQPEVSVPEGSLFAGLSPALHKQLLEAGEHRTLEPGEALFERGELAVDLAVVLEGELEAGSLGRRARVQAGDTVGSVFLFSSRPARAKVTATQPTTVLLLDAMGLEDAGRGLRLALLERLAEKLTRDLDQLRTSAAPEPTAEDLV